jgi:hypothetical protein
MVEVDRSFVAVSDMNPASIPPRFDSAPMQRIPSMDTIWHLPDNPRRKLKSRNRSSRLNSKK